MGTRSRRCPRGQRGLKLYEIWKQEVARIVAARVGSVD